MPGLVFVVRMDFDELVFDALRDEFYAYRRDLATKFLQPRSRLTPSQLFHKWVEQRAEAIAKYDTILREMKLREELDFATLSVAAQELRKLIAN